MRKPPERLEYVRYRCGEGLIDLARVSGEAELAHRRLAEFHWHSGEWPTTLRGNAAALCRVQLPRWPTVFAELATLGWSTAQGRVQHSGVHQVRAEAVAALRSARRAGRMGAERRWTAQKAHGQPSGPGGPPTPPPAQPQGDPNGVARGSLKGRPRVAKGTLCLVKSKSKSKRVSTSSTLKAFNDERLTCTVSPLEKSSGKEKTFLGEVKEMLLLWSPAFAKDELANWGGWWRNRYREKPAKAQRLIAELRGMIREGRVSGNPGAAAVDLWSRLP